jgi:hypothetical protein
MAAVGRLDGRHVERPRRQALSEAVYKLPTIEPGQRIVKPFEANRRAGPAAHSLAARSLEMTGENRDPIGKPE